MSFALGKKPKSPKVVRFEEPKSEETLATTTFLDLGAHSLIQTPPKSIQKLSCEICSKKLTVTTMFKCKCHGQYCSVHRYSDRHSCSFDYKLEGRRVLIKNNPLLAKDKVIRI
jgi:hypothetical protein